MSFAGLTMLNSTTIKFILFLTMTKLLLIFLHNKTFDEFILSKEKQVSVLNDSVSKGTCFADNPFLVECFYISLHYQLDHQWIFTIQNETD